MKNFFITFAFFTFICLLNKSEKIEFVPEGPTCDQRLLKSFGFQGFDEPQKEELKMCPFIQNSCCTLFDQEEIYSQWVINKEQKDLDNRFEFYTEVYNRLLKKGDDFHEILLQILKQMKIKSFSNCKIIASKLAQFQFKTISEQLKEAIRSMYQYYRDIYGGFYCTLCDADSQPFIRIAKKEIIFQKKFCRDIISQSLNVLLYLHINLKKYFNLATRFISNCDFEGNYKKSDADDSFIFTITKENHDLINNCKEYRNEVFWMEFCQPICDKFNLFKLDEFFFPNLKQFTYYNSFFGKALKKLQEQQEKAIKKQKKLKKKQVRGLMDFRILEENQQNKQDKNQDNDKSEKQDVDEEDKPQYDDLYYVQMVQNYIEEPIYYEPQNIPFPLQKFKPKYADSDIGIDMTVIGKKTEINEKIYKYIQAEKRVEAQKEMQKQNGKELENIANETKKQQKDKESKNKLNIKNIFTSFFIFYILFNQIQLLISKKNYHQK